MTARVAVVSGVRTPFTRAGTIQARVPAHELGRVALREAVERAGIFPDQIDEVIFGNIAGPPEATNVARVVALRAGIPLNTPAYTVNRNCGSALQAVTDGVLRIQAGQAKIVAVGGTESMSQIPLLFPESIKTKLMSLARGRTFPAKAAAAAGFRPRDFKPRIGLEIGLTDNYCGLNMGETAERLAREFHISREAQDDFALQSHQRASAAQKAERFREEITPVPLPPDYGRFAAEDNGIRHEQSLEALDRLKPYFDRRYGTVTAGNSSQITDGAGALVLASQATVETLGLPVLGWIRSHAYIGLDPARMGLGPAFATPRALERAAVELRQIGLIELNEAFAAQVLANEVAFASATFAQDELGLMRPIGEIDRAKLNVNGGAIALGHPVGATGARLVLTLLLEMKRRQVELGLVTLCIGGGQGAALVLEGAA